MSAAKHTPGPWRYYESGANSRIESLEWHIAHVAFAGGYGEGNGQLMAAAPEMLDALRQAERWIVQQMLDNGCPAERLEHPPAGSHLFNIRAAIAKATGSAA